MNDKKLWKEKTCKVREYLYECVINRGNRDHYRWHVTVEARRRCDCETAAKAIVSASTKEKK